MPPMRACHAYRVGYHVRRLCASAEARWPRGGCGSLIAPHFTPRASLGVPVVPVYPGFITAAEEEALLADVEPPLARRRYEKGHWDAVIAGGYREMQLRFDALSSVAREVAERVRARFPVDSAPLMPTLHALELSEGAYIGPHVDSVKFSGGVVAGISLLSDAVMVLTPAEADGDSSGPSSLPHSAADDGDGMPPTVSLLLPRRSLYVLAGDARYHWQHAVPAGEVLFEPSTGPCDACGWGGGRQHTPALLDEHGCHWTGLSESRTVQRRRRISLIFRDEGG